MGWSSGTTVCIDAWSDMHVCVPLHHRPQALAFLIIALQSHDWDCEDEIESVWPEVGRALEIAKAHWEEQGVGPVELNRLTERERKILYEGKWS